MKYIILLLLIPLIAAETTFSDNPEGFFILGNSATGVVTGGTTNGIIDGITGGGSCRYEWNCTNWSKCFLSNRQTRNCTNIGTCSDTYKTPEMEQNCTYTFEGEIITEEIDKNEIIVCFIITLMVIFIIFYLEKNYLKKLVRK